MKKRIVLCADDYGQALAISQGILTLIQQGVLSATSCLVNTPAWQEQGKWLLPYCSQIDIGLHFNLTEGHALSTEFRTRYGEHLFSLPTLMFKCLTRALNPTVIQAECEAQIDKFVSVLQRLPRFIDGHQHIHQFPVVRAAIIAAYKKRLAAEKAYVRLAKEKILTRDCGTGAWLKKVIIHLMGAQALKKLLIKHDIPHNQSFSGVYAFNPVPASYRHYFQHFLQQSAEEGGLIMCHPALAASLADSDTIAAARHAEYAYFSSPQFKADCVAQGVIIARF